MKKLIKRILGWLLLVLFIALITLVSYLTDSLIQVTTAFLVTIGIVGLIILIQWLLTSD